MNASNSSTPRFPLKKKVCWANPLVDILSIKSYPSSSKFVLNPPDSSNADQNDYKKKSFNLTSSHASKLCGVLEPFFACDKTRGLLAFVLIFTLLMIIVLSLAFFPFGSQVLDLHVTQKTAEKLTSTSSSDVGKLPNSLVNDMSSQIRESDSNDGLGNTRIAITKITKKQHFRRRISSIFPPVRECNGSKNLTDSNKYIKCNDPNSNSLIHDTSDSNNPPKSNQRDDVTFDSPEYKVQSKLENENNHQFALQQHIYDGHPMQLGPDDSFVKLSESTLEKVNFNTLISNDPLFEESSETNSFDDSTTNNSIKPRNQPKKKSKRRRRRKRVIAQIQNANASASSAEPAEDEIYFQ